MHIFLTGPKGIGKSTIIMKILELLEESRPLIPENRFTLGGFFTHSGLPGDRDIYISPAASSKYYTHSNKIATRDGIIPTAHTEVFEKNGVDILKQSKDAHLIIMDELGFLEQNAPAFQNMVISCINNDIPILGTLRQGNVPWLEQIKSHPKIKVVEVDLQSRNNLPLELIADIGAIINQGSR